MKHHVKQCVSLLLMLLMLILPCLLVGCGKGSPAYKELNKKISSYGGELKLSDEVDSDLTLSLRKGKKCIHYEGNDYYSGGLFSMVITLDATENDIYLFTLRYYPDYGDLYDYFSYDGTITGSELSSTDFLTSYSSAEVINGSPTSALSYSDKQLFGTVAAAMANIMIMDLNTYLKEHTPYSVYDLGFIGYN